MPISCWAKAGALSFADVLSFILTRVFFLSFVILVL